MKKRQREVLKPPAAALQASPWTIASAAFACVLAVYVIAFYATEIEGAGTPRGAVWLSLLLPDEVARSWLGDGGAFAIFDRLPILLGAMLLHLTAWALGSLTLRATTLRNFAPLERGLVTHGAGLSLLSLATLGLGLAGGLHLRWPALGAAAVMIAIAIAFRRRDRQEALQTIPGNRSEDWLSPWWLLLAAPTIAFLLLGGMLPPIEFDVREYHLQAPKEFFELGRITFLPHNAYANMPLGAEMWSLAAMVATGDWWNGALIGKTVIASLTPLTALALYAAGLRLGSRTIGIVAAVSYGSFPWILQVSALGLIDGVLAYYAALVLLLMIPRDGVALDRPTVLLTAFLAGSAAACKYPALLFIALPTLVGIGWASRPGGAACMVRNVTVASLAVAVACGPWFLKNLYFTGNPTYPLFYTLFDGATRTAENAAQWNAAHRPSGFALSQLLNDGLRLALTSPWLSPVLVPLAGFGIFVVARSWKAESPSRRATLILSCSFVGFTLICWWCFTHRIDRFWLPVVPALALLAGHGSAAWTDRLGRVAVIAALALAAAWSLLLMSLPDWSYHRYFAPLAELRVSPTRVDPWILELNERGGRTLVIGEAAVFDLQNQPLYNTTFDPSWLQRYGVEPSLDEVSLAGFDKLIKDHQVEYIYVDWAEINRYRSPGNYGFDPRVTPELFRKLIVAGRLREPLPKKKDHDGEVYPVK